MIAERMRELGIVLPPVFPPVRNYVACVVDGDLVWVGGPEDGERRVTGKVGADLSLEQARRSSLGEGSVAWASVWLCPPRLAAEVEGIFVFRRR